MRGGVVVGVVVVQSVPISEMATRAAFSSTRELLRVKAEASVLTARLLIARGSMALR